MIEVELKFAVDSLDRVRDQFLELGATLQATSHQSDEYLNDPLRDFAKLDMAVRVRSDNDQYCLTYKGPNQDATAKIRQEIEMPLVDEAAAEQMKAVFEGIGFFSVAKVVKQRESLGLVWQESEVQICLDEVSEVGQFVELELVVADQEQVESAKSTLMALAEYVGLSHPTKVSYLQQLLKKRGLL